ncbi:MAG: hypothetical protein FWC95_01730 [Defluviitaleaceae bacterium]|nr:hypothetical protein [Defluviitaleaceae bacterium]
MTIEQARRILKNITNTAHDSSLTGTFQNGAAPLVQAYNAIFKYAITQQWFADIGVVSELDMQKLPPSGEDLMDYIGCAAAVLAGMLE